MARELAIQQSDIDGIRNRGATARRDQIPFFDNPYLVIPMGETVEDFLAWEATCNAWSAGWFREDAGRDLGIAALSSLDHW